MSEQIFIVSLDEPRPIKWTFGAQARLGSLPRPPELSDLAKPRKSYSALCSFLWASLTQRNHPFDSPEDLAERITTIEQRDKAMRVFLDAFKSANENASKKAGAEPAPSPASNSA